MTTIKVQEPHEVFDALAGADEATLGLCNGTSVRGYVSEVVVETGRGDLVAGHVLLSVARRGQVNVALQDIEWVEVHDA